MFSNVTHGSFRLFSSFKLYLEITYYSVFVFCITLKFLDKKVSMNRSTTIVFLISILRLIYDFACAFLYFCNLLRTVRIIEPITFAWLSGWQFGADVLFILGLTFAPWCGPKINHRGKIIMQYIVNAFWILWIFAGSLYWYTTYKDEISGAPSPVDDPTEFSILFYLYGFGALISIWNHVSFFRLWTCIAWKKQDKKETTSSKRMKGKN